MTNIDTTHFKDALTKELATLLSELKEVARRNPSNPNDWEPIPAKMDIDPADENIVADSIEEFEENAGITKQLEIQYNDVKAALDKITNGAYGLCETCKEQIERDRLEANPAARTCMRHMNG